MHLNAPAALLSFSKSSLSIFFKCWKPSLRWASASESTTENLRKNKAGTKSYTSCHSDEHTKKDTYNTKLATAVSSRTGIAARVLGLRQAHSMRIATHCPQQMATSYCCQAAAFTGNGKGDGKPHMPCTEIMLWWSLESLLIECWNLELIALARIGWRSCGNHEWGDRPFHSALLLHLRSLCMSMRGSD